MPNENVILIGSSGTIGRAISKGLKRIDHSIDSSIIRKWDPKDINPGFIKREFRLKPSARNILIYTLGNTNPRANVSELDWIHFDLPMQILRLLQNFESIFVTFGSVLEPLSSSGENRYLSSKRRYLSLLESIREDRYLHFQLNTIYGGFINPSHMLLGQLQHAIQRNAVLELSSGRQIREYQHIEDLATILLERIASKEVHGVQQINHGGGITIREMAQGVMDRFGLLSLLRFDSLPDPEEDNYFVRSQRSFFVESKHFRETISGIYGYLNQKVRS